MNIFEEKHIVFPCGAKAEIVKTITGIRVTVTGHPLQVGVKYRISPDNKTSTLDMYITDESLPILRELMNAIEFIEQPLRVFPAQTVSETLQDDLEPFPLLEAAKRAWDDGWDRIPESNRFLEHSQE